MADETQELSPVVNDRPPPGRVQLVSPYDQRVYTVDEKYIDTYKQQGFVPPSTAQVRSENILRNYEHSWRSKAAAVGEGLIQGVPGATTLASKILPDQTFQSLQQDTALNQQAHPYYNIGGRVLGGIGTVAALTATGGAVGGALGLGGAAAAEGTLAGGAELGSALLGETGAAAAEGSTLGAEFATPLAAGAGEQAATLGAEGAIDSAGNTLSTSLGKVTAPSWGQAAGKVGKSIAENAAIGGIFKVGEGSDNTAMAHALEPNGQEHLSYGWKSALTDFIDGAESGAAWGAGFEGLGAAFKGAAAKLAPLAQKQLERGLFDTQKLNEALQGVADTSIMQTVREMNLTELPKEKLQGSVTSALKGVEGRMNIFKDAIPDARMTVQDHIATQGELDMLLAGSSSGQKFAKTFAGNEATFQELQMFRRKLYDAVDYSRMDLPENQAFEAAGQAVKKSMLKLLENADPGVQANQSGLANEWNALDQKYHDLNIIQTSLKKGADKSSLPWLAGVVGVATVAKLGAGAVGVPGVGTAVAGTVGLIKSVEAFKRFVTDSNLGAINKNLAKGFDASASGLSKAVEGGLYGGIAAYSKKDLAKNYQAAAAQSTAWMQDREQGVVNTREALEHSGVPSSMAMPMATLTAQKQDYLAQAMPRPPRVAADIVTHSQPDLPAQNKWLGKVRSMQDPKYAIAHPTASNLEVLQKFYPSILEDTQNAVLEQVRNNPSLPLDSKLWASKILGRPITPAATHMFYTVLTAARQQSDQAAAQQGQTGGGAQKPVQSSGTRLDALQNPQD
jgi:hypothetical protein